MALLLQESQAEDAGVTEGMRLVGFNTERLDRSIDWTRLQQFASKSKGSCSFLFTNEKAPEPEVSLGPAGFVQQTGELSFDVGPAEERGFECDAQLVVTAVEVTPPRICGSWPWNDLSRSSLTPASGLSMTLTYE